MNPRGSWRRFIALGRNWKEGYRGGGPACLVAESHPRVALDQSSSSVNRFPGFETFFRQGVIARHWEETGLCRGRNVSSSGLLVVPLRAYVRHYAAPLNKTGRSAQSSARGQKGDPNADSEPEKPERKINRAIVSRTIRLIVGEGHEILTRMEALKRAEFMDLDLVEVDSKQDPPVCKLMDFNKEKFKDKQREKDQKKKQSERRRLDDLKEVRVSTRTEQNDLELKSTMAQRLLSKGHRVKLTVVPHGNDDLALKGREIVDRMVFLLQDVAKVETGPKIEKQRAWALVRPILSKIKKESIEKVEPQ